MELVIVVVAAVVGIFFGIVIFATKNYIKAEPNEALIFTGRRHKATGRGWRAVVGGAKFRIPVLEKVSRISLKTMNLPNVRVEKAWSQEGVPVSVETVANVKISSEQDMLARAVERFLETNPNTIQQIMLYQERDMFVQKVLAQAGEELAKIGVIIDIINIQDIRDEKGYLEALGRKRTAEVKKDARIGEAEADRDATIRSETAVREGEVVRAEQQRQIAEAEKDRDVAKQQYDGETLAAMRKAEQQGPLAEAKARQQVVIEEQKVLEEQQRAREKVEGARAEAEEQKYRADRVVPADAEKQSAILRAEGEATAVLRKAEAEAKGIQLKLEAEAEGLRQKAEAWNSYGKAAQLNLVLEAIKVVAEEGAKSIGQVQFDKVIALDGGGDDSAVNRMLTAAPGGLVKFLEQIRTATGIDLAKLLEEAKSAEDGGAQPTGRTGAGKAPKPQKPKGET
jgi:flotillin